MHIVSLRMTCRFSLYVDILNKYKNKVIQYIIYNIEINHLITKRYSDALNIILIKTYHKKIRFQSIMKKKFFYWILNSKFHEV